MPFATIALFANVIAVTAVAWPTCRSERSRWLLIITMITIPWLAWVYWVPRAIRYWLERRRRFYQITAPGGPTYSDRSIPYQPDRLAHRHQRRQDRYPTMSLSERLYLRAIHDDANIRQHDDSVRFWLERQQNGTPTEQVIAPQMLTLLSESAPPGGLQPPVSPLWFKATESDR